MTRLLPLSIPQFRAFAQLRFFMAMGWHAQAIVVSWYVWSVTRDPLMLAMIGLAEAIPAIGLALPMGYIVEGMEKRRALMLASSVIITSAVVAAFAMQPAVRLMLGDNLTISLLLFMIMVNGAARAVYSPAMFSALSRIISREMMPQASALSSTIWQTAMIAGPLIAGLTYAIGGVGVASALYVGLMVAGSLGGRRLSPMDPYKQVARGRMAEDVLSGLRFIFATPVLVSAMALDLFAVLFGGVTALLPVFANDILGVGESGLGLLRASMSIGSVGMMTVLSFRPLRKGAGRRLLFSVAGFGAATIAFAFSRDFWLSVGLLMLAGMFDSISVVVRHTILQLYTPEEMKGRVAAASTMFISSSNELGAVESGIAARILGVVPSVVFGGTITLLVVAIVSWKARALRSLDIQD